MSVEGLDSEKTIIIRNIFENLKEIYGKRYTAKSTGDKLIAAKNYDRKNADASFVNALYKLITESKSVVTINSDIITYLIENEAEDLLTTLTRFESEGLIKLDYDEEAVKQLENDPSFFKTLTDYTNLTQQPYLKILTHYKNLTQQRDALKKQLQYQIVSSSLTSTQKTFALELLDSLRGKTCEATGIKPPDFDRNDVVGWDLVTKALETKSNPNENNEINIYFHGTGTIPLFLTEHRFVHEGGNPLAHQAFEKAKEGYPTFLVKGVSTMHTNEFSPIEFIIDNKKEVEKGAVLELTLGYGIHARTQLAMEEFFIPQVMELIGSRILNNKDAPHPLNVNIAGHSRGAINAMVMADCVDKWMQAVKNADPTAELQIKSAIQKKYPQLGKKIDYALVAIKMDQVKLNTNLMALDPVEGKTAVGDNRVISIPTVSVKILNVGEALECQYSQMPESVKNMTVRLAQDERRVDFQPTIPTTSTHTRLNIQADVGIHSAFSGNTGNSDRGGQRDGFNIYKDSQTAKAAADANIDAIELDIAKTMSISELPPIRFSILERVFNKNIYNNNGESFYPKTKKAILDYIEKTPVTTMKQILVDKLLDLQAIQKQYIEHDPLKPLEKEDAFNSIEREINALKVELELLKLWEKRKDDLKQKENWAIFFSPDDLTYVAEVMIKRNKELNRNLYYILESDIYDNFLSSKQQNRREEISTLQNEMRLSTTTVVGQVVALPLQNSQEDRKMYKRSAKSIEQKSIQEFYSMLKPNPSAEIFYARTPTMGGTEAHQFANPYYLRLENYISELKSLDPQQQYILDQSAIKINELCLNFQLHASDKEFHSKGVSAQIMEEMWSQKAKDDRRKLIKDEMRNLTKALDKVFVQNDPENSLKTAIKNKVIALMLNKIAFQFKVYPSQVIAPEVIPSFGDMFSDYDDVIPREQQPMILMEIISSQIQNLQMLVSNDSIDNINFNEVEKLAEFLIYFANRYIDDGFFKGQDVSKVDSFYTSMNNVKSEIYIKLQKRMLSQTISFLLSQVNDALVFIPSLMTKEDRELLEKYKSNIEKLQEELANLKLDETIKTDDLQDRRDKIMTISDKLMVTIAEFNTQNDALVVPGKKIRIYKFPRVQNTIKTKLTAAERSIEKLTEVANLLNERILQAKTDVSFKAQPETGVTKYQTSYLISSKNKQDTLTDTQSVSLPGVSSAVSQSPTSTAPTSSASGTVSTAPTTSEYFSPVESTTKSATTSEYLTPTTSRTASPSTTEKTKPSESRTTSPKPLIASEVRTTSEANSETNSEKGEDVLDVEKQDKTKQSKGKDTNEKSKLIKPS